MWFHFRLVFIENDCIETISIVTKAKNIISGPAVVGCVHFNILRWQGVNEISATILKAFSESENENLAWGLNRWTGVWMVTNTNHRFLKIWFFLANVEWFYSSCQSSWRLLSKSFQSLSMCCACMKIFRKWIYEMAREVFLSSFSCIFVCCD